MNFWAIDESKNNKSIIVSKADKGNITVIQNRSDYDRKFSSLIETDDYTLLKADPTKSLEIKLNYTLSRIPQKYLKILD
jgi:hypothetical protein